MKERDLLLRDMRRAYEAAGDDCDGFDTRMSAALAVAERYLSGSRGSSDAFERFWNVWPNKVGKPAALKAFKPVALEIESILAGVVRYVRDKPVDRAWLNPATFLNQRRWEDQPAPVSPQLYDTRKDGIALLMQEIDRHERQVESIGGNVRGLPLLPSVAGDAVGDA